MSLTVAGKARLITDPKRGRTGAGKPWANAVVRVSVWRKSEAGWEEASSYVCTVVGFEDTAVALVAFVKGDEVEIRGRIREIGVWQPKTGDPRAQLSVALDDITAPVKRASADRSNAAVPSGAGRG
jgi:single-stranded DNA-binding protein